MPQSKQKKVEPHQEALNMLSTAVSALIEISQSSHLPAHELQKVAGLALLKIGK